MNVNMRPLAAAIESSKDRLDHLEFCCKNAHDNNGVVFNELMVLHNLFLTMAEAVAELQKQNNSYDVSHGLSE